MKRHHKRKIKLNKNGAPAFRAWDTLALLIVFMSIVFFIGHKTKIAEVKTVEAQEYKSQVEIKQKVIASQSAANIALLNRLSASSKIETPLTTKLIVQYYVRKYFKNDADRALKVFTCESNLNPYVVNKNTNKSIDRGVAQINSVHAKQFEQVTGLEFEIGAHDIDSNIKFAKWLYDDQGFNPWVCYHLLEAKS